MELTRRQLRHLIREALDGRGVSLETQGYLDWARSAGQHPSASSVVEAYLDELASEGVSEERLRHIEDAIHTDLGFRDPMYRRFR